MNPIQFLALTLSALVVVGTTGSAFASPFGRVVNERQYNEHHQIRSGLRNGSLTPTEARRLANKQRQITHLERVARADGRITPDEARRLDRLQDRQQRAIFAEKRDGQTRY